MHEITIGFVGNLASLHDRLPVPHRTCCVAARRGERCVIAPAHARKRTDSFPLVSGVTYWSEHICRRQATASRTYRAERSPLSEVRLAVRGARLHVSSTHPCGLAVGGARSSSELTGA